MKPSYPIHARGFSLMELLAVVAIIAILSAFAIPAYSNYLLRGKVKSAGADLMALSAVVENQRQRTLNYPADAGVTQFSQWNPSSSAEEFSFGYEPQDGGYRLTAEWIKDGKLSGCELSLDQKGAKSATEACMVSSQWQ